ncbi:hypothetical protein BH09SUM1_BH09SUM1_30770 [soil metagenome]
MRNGAASAIALSWAAGFAAGPPRHFPHETRKLSQLTGDYDQPLREPTLNRTDERSHVIGTDLGNSFLHHGKLVFLFGDTFGRPGDQDSFAFGDTNFVENPALRFPKDPDGAFEVIDPPGILRSAFCVPSGGISVAGKMDVFYTSDWRKPNMTRSVLLQSADDGENWRVLLDVSKDDPATPQFDAKFINCDAALVKPGEANFPFSTDAQSTVLIWGSGAYRASDLYLVAAPEATFEDKSTWRYRTAEGWSASESDAAPLFHHPQIGEFSVEWIAQLGRWMLLYNSTSPRGIVMRTAEKPWGPWSEPDLILDPWKDRAYGEYMHIKPAPEPVDLFSDPGRENEFGGEYAPYLIPGTARGTAERCEIFYVMSTWNPYETVLMRSVVGNPPMDHPLVEAGETLPGDKSWKVRGEFIQRFDRKGAPCVTTFTSQKDAATGYAWFDLDADVLAVEFEIHGGHAEFMVVEDAKNFAENLPVQKFYDLLKARKLGNVAFLATGANSNEPARRVHWDIRACKANRRLVLIDNTTSPWGFVSLSPVQLFKAGNS